MAIDLGDIPSGTSPSPAEQLQIRKAIGVGTTDAPTFLAQTLTGQSLTGTQATSLVDMAATWNTTGTPSALKLNVTDTASNAASNLMDLQVGGVSKLSVTKTGQLVLPVINNSLRVNSTIFFGTDGSQFYLQNAAGTPIFALIGNSGGPTLQSTMPLGWGVSANAASTSDTFLYRDGAAGILAQRNGVNAQAFRVYNTFLGTTANEWAELDWKTDGTLRLGTNQAGTGAIKAVNFVVGGTARWGISGTTNPSTTGHLLATADNTYDIGASGANRPRTLYTSYSISTAIGDVTALRLAQNGSGSVIRQSSDGVMKLSNNGETDFNRIQLGGTTSAFPAIKRNGTGIDIVLADNSAFAPVKGKITTDTNYTVGAFSPTGFLTLYDATGTAYKVACSVYP